MIAITGVSGYIGFHLARFLKESKIEVKGIIKKGTSPADLSNLKESSIPYTMVDFFDEHSVSDALAGATAIVHLVGSIYQPKKMTLETLHKTITSTVIHAAKKNKVNKIIYVSALGSTLDAPSDYHKTKAQAEEEIKKSGIPYVILRPSLIFGKLYGQRNSKLISRMAQSIEKLPFIPLIGSGQNKLQPLFIMDLVRCIHESIISDKIKNTTIELGGPAIMTLEEIARTIAQALKQDGKSTLHIPKQVAQILALIMERVSDQPKITRDQIKMSGKDNIVTTDDTSRFFNFARKSMSETIGHLL